MKSSSMSILGRVDLPPAGRILLAFSGGEDSLFLLYALSVLAPGRSGALYINHNLRGKEEIRKEMERNRNNAASLSVPFDTREIPPFRIRKEASRRGISVEAEAREERYALLEDYRKSHGYDWIVTAHHRDDQAESVAMRILSFSPFWAWSGIRKSCGRIWRPILSIGKKEILTVLDEALLSPSYDSTNSDTAIRRNYMRRFIMPLISDEAKESLCAIAGNVASLSVGCIPFSFSSPVFVSFSRQLYLSSLPPARERTFFRAFALMGEENRLTRRYLAEIDSLIQRGEKRKESKNYVIYVTLDSVRLYRKLSLSFRSPFLLEKTSLPSPFAVSTAPGGPLQLSLDAEVLSSCVLRSCEKGDTIDLVDGKRKVSSLLKELKVPYAFILEKDGEAVAFLSSFLGGRDRVCARYKGRRGVPVEITIQGENKTANGGLNE